MSIKSFIRFVDTQGNTAYGEPALDSLSNPLEGTAVDVLSGDPFTGLKKTGKATSVAKLLCPLESTPIVLCIGLNYRQHVTEAKLTVPNYPSVFVKPSDALVGSSASINIHKDLQNQLDYEGELCVIIGRTAKNVSETDALQYVLGYTMGNDLTCRYYQVPENSGGQFGYAKSFDCFAPIGPAIVTSEVVPDPHQLEYTTEVNGQVRQSTGTSDMIWSVAQIVAHLSRATTLRPGTVIMTGTPSGVGFFMDPKGFLKDGDVVTVECKELGVLSNKMAFEH